MTNYEYEALKRQIDGLMNIVENLLNETENNSNNIQTLKESIVTLAEASQSHETRIINNVEMIQAIINNMV